MVRENEGQEIVVMVEQDKQLGGEEVKLVRHHQEYRSVYLYLRYFKK